jgi:hypothetical protein
MAMAQPTLELHTQEFVDSLAGAADLHLIAGRLAVAFGPRHSPSRSASALRDPEHYQYDLNLPDITEVWRRGSVIASWLLRPFGSSADQRSGAVGLRGPGIRRRPVDHQSRHRRSRAGACCVICPL